VVILDPMCGSGTLLIEAALLATRTAPGLFRASWPFQVSWHSDTTVTHRMQWCYLDAVVLRAVCSKSHCSCAVNACAVSSLSCVHTWHDFDPALWAQCPHRILVRQSL